MNINEDIDCECTCEENDFPSGLIITDVSSPCCSTRTHELSNTNNLQITSIELPKDITSFPPLFINRNLDHIYCNAFDNSYTAAKEHVPKAEIPILISSLLI